ncbi:MAG: family 16 glycosylhydrolase [Clostridia bacterium]|nr:family 16 glycosylhydrolase [Clostridia bacterium]
MKIFIKRLVCFALAVIMVISVVGCKETKKKKPQKVVVRDKITVVPSNKDENNDSTNSDVPNNSVEDLTTRAKRDLLKKEKVEKIIPFDELYPETSKPTFKSTSVDWAGPEDYVIVYSPSKDKNGAPTNARVLAEKLKTFFKDNDNVDLPVYKDTDPALTGNEKMILVGDTAYQKSDLSEKEYALTLLDNGNLFFEGGHIVMTEAAIDWFRTVKREKGKLALITGESDDFTSTLTLDGKEYVYVWGDEFDGEEYLDKSKWCTGDHMVQNPDFAYFDSDEHISVENGRLRMTAKRYLSETNATYGYSAIGSVDTPETMAYRSGYIEIDARLSYVQGCLPPLWLMSNPEEAPILPREQYTAPWTVEIDIFETFGNGNMWDVSFHKYYKSYDYVVNGKRYSNGITFKQYDEVGNQINEMYYNGTPLSDKIIWNEDAYATYGTITQYRHAYHYANYKDGQYYNPAKNREHQYVFEGEALEKLNETYHTYGFLHDAKGYKVYLDGECWFEGDWLTDIDARVPGFDCDNNNGWGYDLYYYLIMNQYIYTPASKWGSNMWVVNESLPISSYIDAVRLYQLPDQIDVLTPAYSE